MATVELPPGCIITSRSLWERQQEDASRLEAQNRRLAEDLQLARTTAGGLRRTLTAANVALRKRLEESETLAMQAMADLEQERGVRVAREVSRGKIRRALTLAEEALERVWAGVQSRNAYGGTVDKAVHAIRSALADFRKTGISPPKK